MTQFWRLARPSATDYRDVSVNGEVRALHELPVTGCRTCARRRDSRRVLPVDCPPDWRGRPEVTPQPRRDHRVTNAEFAQLRAELAPAVGPLPAALGALEPGDRFQPLLLRVRSRPDVDVLWPELGGFLISERVKTLWESEGVTGVAFARVEYDRVQQSGGSGRRRRMEEPEDLLRDAVAPDSDRWPKFFHVTITGESGLPPGVDPESICSECGRAVVPVSGSTRRIVFEPEMWRGEDVCRLATTAYVIVTDRIKQGLERVSGTNVLFKPANEEVSQGSAV